MNADICTEKCLIAKNNHSNVMVIRLLSGGYELFCSYIIKEGDNEWVKICSSIVDKKFAKEVQDTLPGVLTGGGYRYCGCNFGIIYPLLSLAKCSKNCPYAVEHELFDARETNDD